MTTKRETRPWWAWINPWLYALRLEVAYAQAIEIIETDGRQLIAMMEQRKRLELAHAAEMARYREALSGWAPTLRERIHIYLATPPAEVKSEPPPLRVGTCTLQKRLAELAEEYAADHNADVNAECLLIDFAHGPLADDEFLRLLDAYAAPPSPEIQVPDGWQLVPIKKRIAAGLTSAMHDAFWNAFNYSFGPHGHYEATNAAYNAMLAAAPQPPSPGADVVKDAARYRFMRDPPAFGMLPLAHWTTEDGDVREAGGSSTLSGFTLDAAIDAAMSNQEPQT